MSIDFLKRVALFVAFVPKWGVLTWAFVMGLTIDIFTNTPGLAAASLTAVAAIQPYFYALFIPRDAAETLEPSLINLGPTKYSYYVVTLVTIYCLLFFTLEMFNFDNLLEWTMSVGGSILVTLALIFTFEIAKRRV